NRPRSLRRARTPRPQPATATTAWSLARGFSWPGPRTGDRQPVADIGQVIFEVAIFVVLRVERHAANLAVAGGEAPADRTHAAPFGPVDRHRIQDPERGG